MATVFIVLISALMVGAYWYFQKNNVPPSDAPKPVLETTIPTEFTLKANSVSLSGVDQESTFTLTSTEPLDTGQVKASLAIAPAVEYEVTTENNKDFTIAPSTPLVENTVYNFSIATASENEEEPETYGWAYQTVNRFKVVNTLPGNKATNVPLDSGIEITFSNELYKDWDQHISITPEVKGQYMKYRKTLVFAPDELAPSTLYTVFVSKDLPVEGTNETLGTDYTFKFTTSNATEDRWPYFSFEKSFYEYPTDEAPILSLYPDDRTELPIEVFAFNDFGQFENAVKNQYVDIPYWARDIRTRNPYPTNDMTLSLEFNAQIVATDNYYQFVEFPQTLAEGQYLVQTRFDDYVFQTFLQVTDLSAALEVTALNTLLWAHDLSNGSALNNAIVTYSGATDVLATTTSDGLAQFSTPAPLNDESLDWWYLDRLEYFILQKDNSKFLIPAERQNRYFFWYLGGNTSTTTHWGYVYTNRELYLPSDPVNFWGFVQRRATSPGEVQNVTVKITSGNWSYAGESEAVYAESVFSVSDIGTFEGMLELQDAPPQGYSVKVYDGDQVIASRYIEVATYVKPPYKIEVTTPNRAIFEGDNAVLEVTTTFFDGTPVPNTELIYNSSFGDGSVTTDQNGKATVSLPTTYTEGAESYWYYPRYRYFGIHNAKAEIAEVNAYATLYTFGPKYSLQSEATSEGEYSGTVHAITLEYMNASTEDFDWEYEGDPIAGANINTKIYYTYYDKIEQGTSYDFINKKTVKNYRYEPRETLIEEKTLTTDSDGTFASSFTPEENKNYRIDFVVTDPDGRNAKSSSYVYSGSDFWGYYSSIDSEGQHSLVSDKDLASEENQYLANEQVTMHIYKDGKEETATNEKQFLFFKDFGGIRDVELTNEPRFAFPYEEKYAPNLYVYSVFFDGRFYRAPDPQMLYFDKAQKELNIDIAPDQDAYSPGEEATLDITVTDANGDPVKNAEVNVSNIDEALAAIQWESGVDTLNKLYAHIATSLKVQYISHKELEGMGAEGGGCFTGETKVLMADGSEKPIQSVAVGDSILTRTSPSDGTLAPVNVYETKRHIVSGYLTLNSTLEVTPQHIIYLNGSWQAAGRAQLGDILLAKDGSQVPITSITRHVGPVEVFNLHVEKYHTFIADGIYVHNEKSGDGVRSDLEDIAFFGSARTNAQGKASVTFSFPDNITSWLTTVQAVTEDRKAGGVQTSLIATKPFFVDVATAETYLSQDRPEVKVRGFGKAISAEQNITLEVTFPNTDIAPQTISAKAYEPAFIALPDLGTGSHTIRVKGTAGNLEDILEKTYEVLPTYLTVGTSSLHELTEDPDLPQAPAGRTNLSFSASEIGVYYRIAKHMQWTYGERFDQRFARTQGASVLNQFFGEPLVVDNFDALLFQQTDGGYSILPYGSSDILFTSKVVEAAPSYINLPATTNYLYAVLENKETNTDEAVYALFGLANAGEPVLTDINVMLAIPDLDPMLKVYLARGLASLGAKQYARDLFANLLTSYAQEEGPYVKMALGDDSEKIAEATYQMAVLGAHVDAPEAIKLLRYALENETNLNIHTLEWIAYLDEALQKANNDAVSFQYTLNGETKDVTIEKDKTFSLSLTKEEMDAISFGNINGNVAVVVSYEVPFDPASATLDPRISISRSYSINESSSTTFSAGDIVKVTIAVNIDEGALDQNYTVTDYLPSGLSILTNTYRRGIHDQIQQYPYEIKGQQNKFWAWKTDYTFTYYAIVTGKGTFVGDQAIIQGNSVQESKNVTNQTTITLQ